MKNNKNYERAIMVRRSIERKILANDTKYLNSLIEQCNSKSLKDILVLPIASLYTGNINHFVINDIHIYQLPTKSGDWIISAEEISVAELSKKISLDSLFKFINGSYIQLNYPDNDYIQYKIGSSCSSEFWFLSIDKDGICGNSVFLPETTTSFADIIDDIDFTACGCSQEDSQLARSGFKKIFAGYYRNSASPLSKEELLIQQLRERINSLTKENLRLRLYIMQMRKKFKQFVKGFHKNIKREVKSPKRPRLNKDLIK